jgi:Copine
LDLISNQMLEIVPIVAVDFSLSNLTFDDRKCIHTVNEDNMNEYRDVMTAISKAYRQVSPTSLFYGFGANSVAKKTEVSDLFVGTGDLLNPIVMTDHLDQAYYSCLKRVELNLPVHIASVVSKGIEFAQ